MKKIFLYIVFVLLLINIWGCNKDNSQEDINSDKISVMVTIVPQKYFLEKIGKDKVDILVLVPAGSSPHTYEPKPEQMKKVSKINSYFTIGVEMEEVWIEKIKSVNKDMKIWDTTKGIDYADTHGCNRDHEHDQGHNHGGGKDTHIWTSPRLVKIQAENICNSLIEIDPKNSSYYKENLKEFSLEIDELDRHIKEQLKDLKCRKFMIFHPSWGYFARDYELEMIPIEIDGKEPSASELVSIIDKAKENNIKVIFVNPAFSTKSAEVIANEIGGEVLFISELEEDWKGNLEKLADTFGKVMGKE